MKYIIYSVVLLWSIFSLQSCLKEEENVFGKSSAERLIAKGKEVDEILSAAPHGWYMNYFADSEEKMTGGYQLLCKFDHGKVTLAGAYTIANKYSKIGSQHTSSYSLIESQGPVLSFNTYNPAIHSFADPGSQFDLDGKAGDFEFVVTELSDNRVVMRGLKHNLRIELHALTEEVDWTKYCLDVVAFQLKMKQFSRFHMTESGKDIGMGTLIAEDNDFYNTEDVVVEKRRCVATNNGFDLYEPITVRGHKLSRLEWKEDKFVDKDGSGVEFTPVTLSYEDLLGTYQVMADNMANPVTVTFSEKVKGKSILVSNELLKHEFVIDVDGNRLKINGQSLGSGVEGSNTVYYKLGVYTTTDYIFGTSASYSYTQPLEGLWHGGYIENPELKFFATSTSFLFFSTYAWGVRVLKYKNDTTNKGDLTGYDTVILTNPVFKKL